MAGCDYVLHVASPYPSTIPKNEDEVIIPAREGTLRALRAAKKAGTVKRVFLTSSFASVGYGYAQSERTKENPFTEKDWTRAEGAKSEVGAYEKSKALAEKAAWEWLEKEGEGMEMATVNPVGVFGPVIGGGSSTSLELPTRLLNGQLPGLPDLSFGVVDVRDVASLHLLAMKSPQAAGQRYLAISDELSVSTKEIAEILKSGLPAADSKKVPTRMLPSWLLKIVGHFDSTGALIAPELGESDQRATRGPSRSWHGGRVARGRRLWILRRVSSSMASLRPEVDCWD